ARSFLENFWVVAPFQRDLRKDVDRLRQPSDVDDRLVADNNASRFETPDALQAGARREPDGLREPLDSRAAVALQGRENAHIYAVEPGRASASHRLSPAIP